MTARRAVCGLIALLLPTLLVAVEIVAFLPILADSEQGGYAWLFVTMVVTAAAPVFGVAGVILSIAALRRREPASWLAAVGLVVNAVLVVAFARVLVTVVSRLL